MDQLKMHGFETVCSDTDSRGRTVEIFAFILDPVIEILDSSVCTAKSIISTSSHFLPF